MRFLPKALYECWSLSVSDCFLYIFLPDLMLFSLTWRCWHFCRELMINQQHRYASAVLPSSLSAADFCRPSCIIVMDHHVQVRSNLCMFFCLIEVSFRTSLLASHLRLSSSTQLMACTCLTFLCRPNRINKLVYFT
jgi:hypothetical protein